VPDIDVDLVVLEERAARHAALGDPVRLAVVDELMCSDRAPVELAERFGLASNLLAHHLDVLERVGLVMRARSSGDGRRRYVHLRPGPLDALHQRPEVRPGRALFVCTHNSARSQLAAALWSQLTGHPAESAGTHPAVRVHPGAVTAARRAGLDLGGAVPRLLEEVDVYIGTGPEVVVTVCDQAHEELPGHHDWWHWSIPDPVPAGNQAAFTATIAELRDRIGLVGTGVAS
jgi:ArsR family transcriptional regulator, arsenate/arsenite/antimonite-responsive transcriptional repressor / arsenate reductase (thioredoxin)